MRIARFICHRRNSDVSPGTHLTFSLLPYPLLPYTPYALDVTLEIAEVLAEHSENTYQSSYHLAGKYANENLNPDPSTLSKIKDRLYEALEKLKGLPGEFQQMISCHGFCGDGVLSELLTMANRYQCRSSGISGASGACALSHDWFYLFQKELPYRARDFLFGRPSQKRL